MSRKGFKPQARNPRMSQTTEDVMNGNHYVGEIGVDSGLVFIGDPCYIKDSMMTKDEDWDQFCKEHYADGGRPKQLYNHMKKNGEVVHTYPSGVLVSDFGGDGGYDCTITYKDGQVVKVEVDFDHGDED